MKKTFLINGEKVEVHNLVLENGKVSFTLDGNAYSMGGSVNAEGVLHLHSQGHNQRGYVGARLPKGGNPVFLKGLEAVVDTPQRGRKQSGGSGAAGAAHTAPMPGKLLKVLVKEGQKVAAGDVLVVMEAMKLQLNIEAAYAGEVEKLPFAVGDLVADGDVLVQISQAKSKAS